MVEREIKVFDTLEDLSRAAADRLRKRVAEAAPEQKVSVAFSGGTTPRTMFKLLAAPESGVAWERTELFQVDERMVPPDNAQSNFRAIRGYLLVHVPDLQRSFHRMLGEAEDAARAAEDYALTLEAALDTAPGECPRLDLVYLGMGVDGHTASLFPGSPALEETRRWVRPNASPRVTLPRLTLTYPILNAARELIFMVSGADKAETLRAVLEDPIRPRELPAQGVRPAEGRVRWYVDQAAAQRLRRPLRSAP